MEPNKILVVDDEEYNRELMEATLSPHNYELTMAKDGFEALDQVRRQPPDLILLDLMMPRMDGFSVTSMLKNDSKFRHIPIVIVTALEDVEDRVRALKTGADDFLTKPVRKIELLARVKSLLKVKAYHDHLLHYQTELEDEVGRRTRQLEKALEKNKSISFDTIHRLCLAAEYRDKDTGGHLLRMSNYAAAVARKLGLNDRTVESILYAAPMHDIGKIGIPDSILNKNTKLDLQEWEVMKQHVNIGAQILKSGKSGLIRLAETIALTHHEKWDGSGYPQGLKGKQIPLVGRIVALADVFDALASKRPYKAPFPLKICFDIVSKAKGSHFDPDIVDAFFSVRDEILEINGKYRD